jgi:hypothetical protein
LDARVHDRQNPDALWIPTTEQGQQRIVAWFLARNLHGGIDHVKVRAIPEQPHDNERLIILVCTC